MVASNIFVLPSHYEALPISLLEAMASGLPCVATSVGDVPLIIENERQGLLIALDDKYALVNALKNLLQSPELCQHVSKAARQRSLAFSDVTMAEQVECIYRQLLV